MTLTLTLTQAKPNPNPGKRPFVPLDHPWPLHYSPKDAKEVR